MKRFSKEKWLQSANEQIEKGILSQREVDDACSIWVDNLDGKTEEEVKASGFDVARDDWFV